MQQVAEGVFVETNYDGVNVAAILTRRGVICIDAPSYPKDARHWAMRLRQISPGPIIQVILLDAHGDRVLNTRWLNGRLITHEATRERLLSFDKRFPQPMLDSLALRNPHAGKELISGPVERPLISFTRSMRLFRGGVELVLHHAPGPGPGSIWAYLPATEILFTGDGVLADCHPPLLEADITTWLKSLNDLESRFPATQTIVPGRGAIGDRQLIADMRDYLTAIRKRVESHVADGGARDGLAEYIGEIIALRPDTVFPTGHLPREWVDQQVRQGLENLYDQLVSQLSNRAAKLPKPETMAEEGPGPARNDARA